MRGWLAEQAISDIAAVAARARRLLDNIRVAEALGRYGTDRHTG